VLAVHARQPKQLKEDEHRYTDFFAAGDRSSGHGSPSRAARLAGVPDLKEKEAAARSLGFALLDASRVYEDSLIPRREGRLRRRRVPPFRSATIGLVGRQRRFLRAAYTLADAGQTLRRSAPFARCLSSWSASAG